MTTIAPLEYLVMGLEHDQFTEQILPELLAIQRVGGVRVVDLVFITKDASGTLTTREVHELGDERLARYAELGDSLQGLLTAEDIATLAAYLPANGSAVVVLLEHRWTRDLGEAVARSGGTLLTGGLVSPDALKRVDQELAAAPAR